MPNSTIESDVNILGSLRCTELVIPDATVDDDAVKAAAGIAATKLEHQHEEVFSQESDTTVADEVRVIHVVKGATGTLIEFKVGAVIASVGDAVVDVDLLVNGATKLSTKVRIDSGDAAYALVTGVFSATSLVLGDVIEIDFEGTIGTGTLAKGVFAQLTLREDD